MGRYTRYTALPDQAYDPRVTNMGRPVHPPSPRTVSGALDKFVNRTITNTSPIQLVANVAQRVLPNNRRRVGLLIQNKDTTNDLFIGFGNGADANSLSVPARGFILLDFACPSGEVYAFATANIQAIFVDMTRGY